MPFLFNMKAEDAKQRYQMTLLEENEEQYLIWISPLQELDREAFSKAFIFLDKKTFLPRQLRLDDPNNGKDTKTFIFTKIERNAEINPVYFDGDKLARETLKVKVDPAWKVVPTDQSQPEGPSETAGGASRPVAQPAQAPSPAPRRR